VHIPRKKKQTSSKDIKIKEIENEGVIYGRAGGGGGRGMKRDAVAYTVHYIVILYILYMCKYVGIYVCVCVCVDIYCVHTQCRIVRYNFIEISVYEDDYPRRADPDGRTRERIQCNINSHVCIGIYKIYKYIYMCISYTPPPCTQSPLRVKHDFGVICPSDYTSRARRNFSSNRNDINIR